ncbi:hypothetical protein DEH69_16760 [Streptomyces sp. PT12]|nr:hypothetical protein DEH69_16760 [Streptomyces sp. PT12]
MRRAPRLPRRTGPGAAHRARRGHRRARGRAHGVRAVGGPLVRRAARRRAPRPGRRGGAAGPPPGRQRRGAAPRRGRRVGAARGGA